MMTTQCQTVIFGHSIYRFGSELLMSHRGRYRSRELVGLAGNYLSRGTNLMLRRLTLYLQQLIDQEQIGKQRAKMN
jgi:hypothetical protein